MKSSSIHELLEKAIAFRTAGSEPYLTNPADPEHRSAFRLFNGFTEGDSKLVVDIYAQTVVFHDYTKTSDRDKYFLDDIVEYLRSQITWLRAGVQKLRNYQTQDDRRGRLLFGQSPDTKIIENGIWYALDLTLNQDASFYLDTRILRKWLVDNAQGKSVLNTFAYTGSLGVAALAGGAARVIQVERNRKFLALAEKSYALNNLRLNGMDLVGRDFFPAIAGFKHTAKLFDCVILDPPFFSTTSKGNVDQVNESERLINKVRPLIKDGGWLIAINNAVYVSGRDYLRTLEKICSSGYLKIHDLIPVPEDITGSNTHASITDPAPFNHSTKIALLDVKRK